MMTACTEFNVNAAVVSDTVEVRWWRLAVAAGGGGGGSHDRLYYD